MAKLPRAHLVRLSVRVRVRVSVSVSVRFRVRVRARARARVRVRVGAKLPRAHLRGALESPLHHMPTLGLGFGLDS